MGSLANGTVPNEESNNLYSCSKQAKQIIHVENSSACLTNLSFSKPIVGSYLVHAGRRRTSRRDGSTSKKRRYGEVEGGGGSREREREREGG